MLCSCPQTGFFSRPVGYLNYIVNDHFGAYTTIEVVCAFHGFNALGDPAFTTACGDYKLLKQRRAFETRDLREAKAIVEAGDDLRGARGPRPGLARRRSGAYSRPQHRR